MLFDREGDVKIMRDIINNFKNVNVLIIGDVILDKYLEGHVNRISQEAPIPIVEIKKEWYVPGGASNVASNVASLGGKVRIIGSVGDDAARDILSRELSKRNVSLNFITASNQTTQKIRVIGQKQQIVRIDYEEKNQLDDNQQEELIEKIGNDIENTDVVVISDYAKGLLSKKVITYIIDECNKRNKPIVVDPKPQHKNFYSKATLITPNMKEALEMSKSAIEDNDVAKVGEAIKDEMGSNVLITRGAEGMSLFELDGSSTHIPTKAKEVFDVSGAGDTVVAALALAIASGADLKQASIIANYAAGIVVGKFGTSTVSLEELKGALE